MLYLHWGVVSNPENPSVANGHGIGKRERLVDGVYLGILHHQVRHRRPPTGPLCNAFQSWKNNIKLDWSAIWSQKRRQRNIGVEVGVTVVGIKTQERSQNGEDESNRSWDENERRLHLGSWRRQRMRMREFSAKSQTGESVGKFGVHYLRRLGSWYVLPITCWTVWLFFC